MEKKKVALVGYGQRGGGWAKEILHQFLDKIDIVGVCDKYEDRANDGMTFFKERGCENVIATTEYEDIIALKPDAVIIAAAWDVHVPFACRAMEAGITVGLEVGGAYTLQQCFDLIETYERTKTPFMFLENCYYGRLEALAFNMKEKGAFGEIVHCEGAYRHDLRKEVAEGNEMRHYRFHEYATRNCDNYPTHQWGPIMRLLDIGHGKNRPVSLVSMSSKAVGLRAYAAEQYPSDHPANNTDFAQGDVVTTMIQCENGETVTLTLGTTLPRYYSRGFVVEGTKAALYEDLKSIYEDGINTEREFMRADRFDNLSKCNYAKYDSDLWKEFAKNPVGSHGGMDYLIMNDFINCLLENKPMPIDAYEAAFMMAVTPLSEASIAGGSIPVEFPDFCKSLKK